MELIQKWQKLIAEDLKLELFKMNCEKNHKHPLQLANDLSDEKKKLKFWVPLMNQTNQLFLCISILQYC